MANRELDLNIHSGGFDIVVSKDNKPLGMVQAYFQQEIIYSDNGIELTGKGEIRVRHRDGDEKFKIGYTHSPLFVLGRAFDIADKLGE